MGKLIIDELTCEYRTHFLGTDVLHPRFSWRVSSETRGTVQKAYRIQVAQQNLSNNVTAETEEAFVDPTWDTEVVLSDQSLHIVYQGPRVKPRTKYLFRVKVWDCYGNESAWSYNWWETGLLDSSEWAAQWITPDSTELAPLMEPAFYLRKGFKLKGDIASARIYATGIGLYELYLNGEQVGDALLTPGWTSYHHRLQFQTYDVTQQLQNESNALGIVLGDGWYKGVMGFEGEREIYGDRRAGLLELHVWYADGTEERLMTDSSWKAATGPIRYSEIYHGEIYDASFEVKDWCSGDYNDTEWKKVQVLDLPLSNLVAQENWPTKVTEIIKPIKSFITPAGDTVLDMGQNMVGRIRMNVQAPAGTRIVLQHAEVLDREGNIYFGNLRSAKQKVEYIANGEGMETYAPHFTFQGFRYVKVEGYPGQEKGLPLDPFVGEVIHSDMERTGNFECSDPLVNTLQQNIQWGQRGNFIDVPTDCPQRDERLGWTGDAQVFIGTALFNYQGGPFFTKWLRDLKTDQAPNGSVPFVIPNIMSQETSAAWGDAAVICPWALFISYGDEAVLKEQYSSMKSWVEYIHSQRGDSGLWDSGFHFGDWLGLDAKPGSYVGATPREVVATAYYAYSSRLLHRTAAVLGLEDDAKKYRELTEQVVEAFRLEFVTPQGRLAVQTQTAHVLALMFELVEGAAKERIAHDLNQMIIENEYHLTTGFVGTPYLCIVLSQNGYHQTAVNLLLQKDYPGWLYSVTKGATTIWEHWDGIKPDGTFWSDDMNSFNHYAYGAIGEWMYRFIAGLDMDEASPAYKRIRIHPHISSHGLTSAKAVHRSMYGEIISSWRVERDRVTVDISIPSNTTADIFLPGADINHVREDGNGLDQVAGVMSYAQSDTGVKIEVGSGNYQFVYVNLELIKTRFSINTLVMDLALEDNTKRVLLKHFPELSRNLSFDFAKTKTLGQLPGMPTVHVTEQQVQALIDELVSEFA